MARVGVWWKGLPAVDWEKGSRRRQPVEKGRMVDVDHCFFLLVDVDRWKTAGFLPPVKFMDLIYYF